MCVGDLSEEWSNGVSREASAAKPAQPSAESEVRMARLVSTIEGEIVPRLVLTRRLTRVSNEQASESARAPDPVDVAELVRLLLAHDVGVSSAYVETVRQRGASLEAICLGLLAPAARRLGELWEEDECNFMQVTVGLCRLHQLLRELSPEFRTDEEMARPVDAFCSRRVRANSTRLASPWWRSFSGVRAGTSGMNSRRPTKKCCGCSASIDFRWLDCRLHRRRAWTN